MKKWPYQVWASGDAGVPALVLSFIVPEFVGGVDGERHRRTPTRGDADLSTTDSEALLSIQAPQMNTPIWRGR